MKKKLKNYNYKVNCKKNAVLTNIVFSIKQNY